MAENLIPTNAFDLPIDEVKGYVSDMMSQMGQNATVDIVPSKVMVADLERAYSNLQQSMKRIIFLYDTVVKRGSRIEFVDEVERNIAIVFTNPNDDIVNKSAKILICNSKPKFTRKTETYITDPISPNFGDIITNTGTPRIQYFDGFIERLSAKEKQYDVGLLHDAILRFITFEGSDIQLDDIVEFRNKSYRVIDVDDITEGILVIQLANVRTSQ